MATVNHLRHKFWHSCVCVWSKTWCLKLPFYFWSFWSWALRSLSFFCHHLHSEITVTLNALGVIPISWQYWFWKIAVSSRICFLVTFILMLKMLPRFFICHGLFFRCALCFTVYFSRCVNEYAKGKQKNKLWICDFWMIVEMWWCETA